MPRKKAIAKNGYKAPFKQTRIRSRLQNAPQLMLGLNHRGRADDDLPPDPDQLTGLEVQDRLASESAAVSL